MEQRQNSSSRWTRRRTVIAASLVLVLAAGTIGYRVLTTSTPVSPAEAVARYREIVTEASAAPSAASTADLDQGTGGPASETTAAARRDVPAATSRPGIQASQPGGDAFPIRAPAGGVYTWRTEGSESAEGITRAYPPESQRIVERKSDRTWTNHHIFSGEHEEWFQTSVNEQGAFLEILRARVRFGPITEDRTIQFTPPVNFVPFPFRLGHAWSGSWSGDVHGTYRGKTFDHTTMTLGGEDVEVWANELNFELHGEVEGTATIRVWVAPKYGMTLKEEYHETQKEGPFTYKNDATITLLSLQPRT